MKNPIIKFSNVSKSFGKKVVLNNINLTIYEGEIFAIIGRSGSGKSTLMKILLGVYKPEKGNVIFNKKDITRNSEVLRKVVGLTTQENSFYDKLTVYENMVYYANLYNVKPDILSILKSVELEKELNTMADKLSGGMKKRLDFAISMVHNPKIMILDEPTTGLDPILVKQFWRLVKRVSKVGKTIVIISHIFQDLQENCDRVCILHKGAIKKIVNINSKTDLFHEFSGAVK